MFKPFDRSIDARMSPRLEQGSQDSNTSHFDEEGNGRVRDRRGDGDRNDDGDGRGGRDRNPPPENDASQIVTRSIDGAGTVEGQENWGAVGQELLRLSPADYEDGVGEPVTDRPNARAISNAVSQETGETVNSAGVNDLFWAWGQFIDHDLDLTEAGESEFAPIIAPADDPVFVEGATIAFNRVDPVVGTGEDAPRAYENEITAFMDASMVYGSDPETAASLRDGAHLLLQDDGLLVSTDTGVLAGDVRAAENVALTSLQTLFAREHNRWVDELASENHNLSEDELFDAARMRVEAEIQAITYNEWLPLLVGEDAIAEYDGYDSSVNPGVSIEFSTAAFRFGHSLLSSEIHRLNEDGSDISAGALALREAFFNPSEIEANGGIDPILRGLADGAASELDTQVVEDVRSFLFAEDGSAGLDLAAINIERGRDLGVASYNDLREALGLERVESFSEITSDSVVAAALEEIYGDVDLVDAWIGGLAEDAYGDGMLGELFSVIVIDEFTRIRDGDPLWSEAGAFSEADLEALSATRLSDIIEWNTEIEAIQNETFITFDRLGGNDGNDSLLGAEGRDLILGASGDDSLAGLGGDDQIEGGSGQDTIVGGTGDDLLYGGEDADIFHFALGDGHDVIADFEREDILLLALPETTGSLDSLFEQSGKDVVLTLDTDSSITLLSTQIDRVDEAIEFA